MHLSATAAESCRRDVRFRGVYSTAGQWLLVDDALQQRALLPSEPAGYRRL